MKNYQAVAPPDPIWTRVAYEPEDALEQTSYNSVCCLKLHYLLHCN